MDRPDDRQETLSDSLEIPREKHREESYPGLQAGIEEQRSPERIGPRAQQGVARGQSAHEGGEDRDHGVAGASEEKGQIPRPDDLIKQAGEA